MRLDVKDHKIIALLRKNARLSIRNIAKKTNIRPSTVHQRIKKLVSDGIIEKFTLKLNNKSFGEGFITFILITTKKDLPHNFFLDNRIKDVFGVTGEYDLILKMKFKDVEEFNDYIIKLRKNQFIQKTLTMVVTTTIKEEI